MQITVCDICKADKNLQKITLTYDDGSETFDLCSTCYLSVLLEEIEKQIQAKNIHEYLFNRGLIGSIRAKILSTKGRFNYESSNKEKG